MNEALTTFDLAGLPPGARYTAQVCASDIKALMERNAPQDRDQIVKRLERAARELPGELYPRWLVAAFEMSPTLALEIGRDGVAHAEVLLEMARAERRNGPPPESVIDGVTGEIVEAAEPVALVPIAPAEETPAIQYGDTQLVLAEGLPFDKWWDVGSNLQQMQKSVMWWLGDWWNYGEHLYGETASQAVKDGLKDATGHTFGTIMVAASVARKFESLTRVKDVPWSYHRVVAPLPLDIADEWLERAKREGWKRRRLEAELEAAGLRESKAIPDDDALPEPEPQDFDGNEWYTPWRYIDAARQVMGGIDVDPATCEYAQQRVQALCYFTKDDNGLDREWPGRVWLNPPYSHPEVEHFTTRLIEQFDAGMATQAVLLVNNCTDAGWFQTLLARFPVCFTLGRVRFERPDREVFATRQGQAFFYLGPKTQRFVEVFSPIGTVLFPVKEAQD